MEIRQWLRRCLPRTNRPRRIWSGPLRGMSIVTSWHEYPRAILGQAEPRLVAWFTRHVRPGQTWLDIGAHVGYTALSLSQQVGPAGRVFAFEALPRTAGDLAETKYANRLVHLTVVPLALGDVRGVQRVEIGSRRNMAEWGPAESTFTESIYVVSLDEIWPSLSGDDRTISGIKIDVQGSEIHVVRGMRQLLREFRPTLVAELHPGVDRQEFLTIVTEAGYNPNAEAIEPVPGETTAQLIDHRNYAFHAK